MTRILLDFVDVNFSAFLRGILDNHNPLWAATDRTLLDYFSKLLEIQIPENI